MSTMYSLFRPASSTYGGGVYQAEFVGPRPSYTPHWWEATPLTPPLPALTFRIFHTAPLRDNIWTGTEFELYSHRLIALLTAAHIPIECFPATLISKKTGAIRSDSYQVVHLLDRRPGLDRKKTLVDRPVISPQRMTDPCLLFRDAEYLEHVLIHNDFRTHLERQGITGCLYQPVLNWEDAPTLFNW